jgi:hypothetical protein
MKSNDWTLGLNSAELYVAQCPSSTTRYARLREAKDCNALRFQGWPPQLQDFNNLRARVFRAASDKQLDARMRVEQFRGAVEAGVDAHRTLVSMYRRRPEIFVKRVVRQETVFNIDPLEPIVWIFQPLSSASKFETTWNRQYPWIETSFCSPCCQVWSDRFIESEVLVPEEFGRNVVRIVKSLGMVTFTKLGTSETEIIDSFGSRENALRRVPTYDKRPQLADDSWWEGLLSVAAQYAQKCVFCVTLDESASYAELSSHAQIHGKKLVTLRGSEIGNQDVLKMSTRFFVCKGTMDGRDVTREVLFPKLIRIYKNFIDHLESVHPATYQPP